MRSELQFYICRIIQNFTAKQLHEISVVFLLELSSQRNHAAACPESSAFVFCIHNNKHLAHYITNLRHLYQLKLPLTFLTIRQ